MDVAIIGDPSSSRRHVFPWKSGRLPNVTDFEATVLDLRAATLPSIDLRLSEYQEFLMLLRRQLLSKGQIVVITDNPNATVRLSTKEGPVSLRAAQFIPTEVAFTIEAGKSIIQISHNFERYIQRIKEWQFHFFFVPPSPRELLQVNSYLKNREGNMLAGELWRNGGRLVILPGAELDDPRDAIALALEGLTGTAEETPPPEWAATLEIPTVAALEAQAEETRKQIAALKDHLNAVERERDSILEFRRLAYSTGTELEEIVARTFRLLGAEILGHRYGSEEFVLEFGGVEHLVEVKGVNGSAAGKHLSQLINNLTVAEDKTGKWHHGILLVNAFRTAPPSERSNSDQFEFPPNVVERANAIGIALLTGLDLFFAITSHLNGDDANRLFLDKLVGTKGLFKP